MGITQFHMQPQPRKIIQTPKVILIDVRGQLRPAHIYTDGRKLPPQGEPQPFWYGYSVGRWEGDTLVVETNNLRGAEDGPFDGWLDVNGSPYSQQAKFTERFRRPIYRQAGNRRHRRRSEVLHEAVHRPHQPALVPDEEMIEFVCNENQQKNKKKWMEWSGEGGECKCRGN